MLSNTFCPLPWIHLATRPNGDLRLCCTANASGAGLVDKKDAGLVKQGDKNLNLKETSISKVWNSEKMRQTRLQMLAGEVPVSCTKCFEEESKGIVSKRQWETVVWKDRLDIPKIVNQTSPDGSLPVNIPYFDLRLGNTCQLKCVMCSPHDSSAWIKEWQIQYPKYKSIDLKLDQQWDNDFDYNWYRNSEFLDTIKSQASNIKELYFAGGEPLLIPEHYKILEFMVENGSSRDCTLRYNSNGVELPSKLFDLWKSFKEVKFNFSVDAVGVKNEYIRYPSNWNTIVQNLHILDNTSDNITVNIACAVQLLNVLYVPELVEWKQSQDFKKINLPPYGAGLIGTHLVYLPSYLNVRVLPVELKDEVEKRVLLFCDKNSNNAEFINSPYGRQRWLGLVKYMKSADWSSKLPVLSDYLTTIDNRRGTNFKEVFPELSNLL